MSTRRVRECAGAVPSVRGPAKQSTTCHTTAPHVDLDQTSTGTRPRLFRPLSRNGVLPVHANELLENTLCRRAETLGRKNSTKPLQSMSFRNASWAQDPRKDNDFEALLRGGSSVLIPRASAVTPPISTAAARPGVAARTDDDLTDELAWQARGTMAAASRARTELAAATLTRENKELLQQRLAQGAKVDDDMTDEAAWQARAAFAAASEERQAKELEELAAHNRERLERLEAATAVEDDDITDEAAWAQRQQLREASDRRKIEEAGALARENAEIRQRLARQGARNDADATDETMWAHRTVLRRASKGRKEQESKALFQRNLDLQARLRTVSPSFERLSMGAHETRWGRVLRKSSSQPSALYVGVTSSQAGDLYVGVVRTSSASGGWYARNRPVE